MGRPERFDVAVAGAGPAGLATAIAAASAGLSTIVTEARKPPIDRACGEGVMPMGVAVLQELGVALPAEIGAEFAGIRYLDGGRRAEAEFTGRRGVGIRRTALHRALVERAEEVGVGLRWGTRIDGLGVDGLETSEGPISARYVIAADGRNSGLRRMAGLEKPVRFRRRFGVRRHYAVTPWSRFVEVHWSDRYEAYVTPVAAGMVGVALLTGEKVVRFDTGLREFPELADRLAPAKIVSRDLGAGPFGSRCRSPVKGRLALVGDAAGCLDPISGEGLSVAFQEAAAVVERITQDRLPDYVRDHRRIRRVPEGLTWLLTAAARRPAVRRAMITALASVPWGFRSILRIASNPGRPRNPGPFRGVVNRSHP